MERFAKRKLIIKFTRANNKHVWFREDSGNTYYVGQFRGTMSDDQIADQLRSQWSRMEPIIIEGKPRLILKAGDDNA